MQKDIKECIDSGDLDRLKFIFDDCLDVDPTFEKFADDFEACKNLPGLFEPYQELTPVRKDPSRWDDGYWIKLKTDLIKNFSIARFQHMQEVAKVVYADKIISLKKERSQAAQKSGSSIAVPSGLPKQSVYASGGMKINKTQQQEQEVERLRADLDRQNKEAEKEIRMQKQRLEKERAENQRKQKETEAKKTMGTVWLWILVLIGLVLIGLARLLMLVL
ncbi:MAG: hypothetical protein HFH34_06720 [Eubacterium sp.]|nr:hypothetical protein [Eubacterium sp.]